MHGKTSPVIHDGKHDFRRPCRTRSRRCAIIRCWSKRHDCRPAWRSARAPPKARSWGFGISDYRDRGRAVPSRIDRHARRASSCCKTFSSWTRRDERLARRASTRSSKAARSTPPRPNACSARSSTTSRPTRWSPVSWSPCKLKGESAAELAGGARAMRARARPLNLDDGNVLDTAGTGGDGAGTFNISTGAALVAAAAGVPVAKHGNRAISGRVGAADVLERFGVQDRSRSRRAATMPRARADAASSSRPRTIQCSRASPACAATLGIRTIFNLMAPLAQSGAPALPVARRRRAASAAADGGGAGRAWGRPCDGGARRRRPRRDFARCADRGGRSSRRGELSEYRDRAARISASSAASAAELLVADVERCDAKFCAARLLASRVRRKMCSRSTPALRFTSAAERRRSTTASRRRAKITRRGPRARGGRTDARASHGEAS